MVLDKLGSSLTSTLSKIRNSLTVDRELVEEVVKEIQKALLSADVNVRLVLELTKKIRERAISEKSESLNKRDHLITIIFEELSAFLGFGEEFSLKEGQNRIMLVGLYGQGKTTTAGKLGLYFKRRSKKVALISTDTWRPAAFEQLKQVGERVEISVFGDPSLKSPQEIYKKFSKELEKFDVVIIDSAGRDFLNEELVEEIAVLDAEVQPTDTFLVLGADVGQTAQKQAEMFKEQLAISGVIITKMDGTGKGGGALSACAISQAPVKFIGVGEKTEDFERFNAERFVSQLLGMGDLESLLENARLAMDERSAEKLQEKMMSGEFDLDDLYEQLKSMKKLGSLSKVMKLIPGFGSFNIDDSQLNVQQEKLERWKFIMDSMTKYEKKNPSELSTSRVTRIAKGSGSEIPEVRELLKHYKMTKKMMNMFKDPESFDPDAMQNPQQMMKMMKKLGGKNMKSLMKKGR